MRFLQPLVRALELWTQVVEHRLPMRNAAVDLEGLWFLACVFRLAETVRASCSRRRCDMSCTLAGKNTQNEMNSCEAFCSIKER